jgi:hypothetical protein
MSENRVLVCGGRNYDDKGRLYIALDRLFPSPTLIIHGGANGADALAGQWCVDRDVACAPYYAAWETYGAGAGPMRNQRMLDEGKPHLVLAFPGGRGTADMVRRAKAAGVRVIEAR